VSLLIKHKFHHTRYELQLKGARSGFFSFYIFLFLVAFGCFVFIDVAATCRAVEAAVSQKDAKEIPGGDIMTAA